MDKIQKSQTAKREEKAKNADMKVIKGENSDNEGTSDAGTTTGKAQ